MTGEIRKLIASSCEFSFESSCSMIVRRSECCPFRQLIVAAVITQSIFMTSATADDGKGQLAVPWPFTRPTLIAHRGASGEAPEHTLVAYELAQKYGADFVEPDLQMTKDGVLVCLRDTSLERTTNVAQVFPSRSVEAKGKKTWPVAEFTLEEIQRLDAGSWKDPKFAGAEVPTFQQMIDMVKGKAGIIPETKATEE